MDKTDLPALPKMLIGIGASAGGLEALRLLLAALPGDSDLSFVLVVHLAPEHPSILAELLQPLTSMPVTQVTENLKIEPNHIYVIPPGRNLTSIDSHLRLSELEPTRLKRAAIDHFFETLATSHGDRCIGVILSGTGSDGTRGLKKIKELGGLAIVQDPLEAEYDAMPNNAIASGVVDFILPVRDIARQILAYARTRPRLDIAESLDETPTGDRELIQDILKTVRARTNMDFSKYKQSTILRRIRRRMQLHQKELLGDYLAHLQSSPSEARLLAEDFLITVTLFFRDAETYAYLENEIVPAMFEGKTSLDTIRVWSVGCATGEEAYSLAILLLEHARMITDPPKLEVFASDLHEGSLRMAREGVYSESIAGDMSAERLQRFFIRDDGHYRVRREVRDIVVFASHNLLKDPPFSRLNMIVCRNLLIYLQRDLQNDVIDLFHYALNPNGLLLLGPSESIDRTALFQPENKQHCIYRRQNVPAPEPRLPVFPQTSRRRAFLDDSRPRLEPSASYGSLHQKMVERFAQPSILVDRDFKIVHSSENAGRYLQISGGELSASVFKLAREELRIDLRAALHTAAERGEPARSRPIPILLDGKPRLVVLHIRPSRDADLGNVNLVIFDELEDTEHSTRLNAGPTEGQAELEETKERLRAVIEQYESTQEEMRAANEELQSVNEELRSTLEELETSKEELQSMNEELQTVNQENRHKVEELSQLSGDLQNLMAATEIATLFLDRELRIMRATPRARDLFNIRANDTGRPLVELRHRLGYAQLEEDARRVLEQLTPIGREIQSESGEWFLTRVLPYRTPLDQIQGLVITLVDVTELKNAERALRHSEEIFRALVTASAQTVWTTDATGMVVEDSPSWRSFTGQTAEQWLAKGWIEAVHPDDRELAMSAWSESVANETPFEAEIRLRHVSGDWRWTQVRAAPVRDEAGKVRSWVGMNIDITRRKAEEELREADRRKDEFLAVLGHELRNPLTPLSNAMALFKKKLPPDPELQRIREMAEGQVSHIVRLVDDLLDVARVRSGRMELKLQRIDLRNAVSAAVANFRPTVESHRHELSLDQSSEPLEIDGDEVRLVQIVSNLLDNAIKYTPDGGKLSVRTKRDGEFVKFSVQDNGAGLSPHMATQVFDLFARGDRSEQKLIGGLGLGLPLVRRLAELHGGSVAVRSEGLGRGATFILRLRIAKGLPIDPDSSPQNKRDDRPSVGNGAAARRVLVVDDVREIAESTGLLLELEGHEVRTALDGQSALETVAEFGPDVVVLDIGMPDMDGWDLARELRRRETTVKSLLIAVSGLGRPEDLSRSSAAGIDHHLVKPIDMDELIKLIQQSSNR